MKSYKTKKLPNDRKLQQYTTDISTITKPVNCTFARCVSPLFGKARLNLKFMRPSVLAKAMPHRVVIYPPTHMCVKSISKRVSVTTGGLSVRAGCRQSH